MEIKVLGTGCAKCKTTYQTIEKVISENNLEDVKLTKVEDIVEILNSGIMATPAVVVDGAVKVKGHVRKRGKTNTRYLRYSYGY